ncbi:PREDICTED: small nuclear ribonucleoprotein E isoform X1 [Mandrillus leucophaeus]|uniref:small nuclear ribonucleoprotein E isoform X1 n=1 Tax=Mandrillus leucophaeus TaxID=9568 RepID=UPI0005F3EDEE|nr:PREDICTED: small nuclear ribonucleoprotein E isoform X1 [Mandrillus leucophaeus]XP_025246232.1 small nuclear ribonucleoprotein E isoform X1 [Theropithecus gelada]
MNAQLGTFCLRKHQTSRSVYQGETETGSSSCFRKQSLCCFCIFSLATVVQNLIFRYLQNRSRIQVWLYEQVNMRIEGCIIGFDEYMNLVLDDAEEIHSKTKSRKQLGRIMLKGDNITLLQSVSN